MPFREERLTTCVWDSARFIQNGIGRPFGKGKKFSFAKVVVPYSGDVYLARMQGFVCHSKRKELSKGF